MCQADPSHLDPGGVNGSLTDAGVHQIRQRLHRDAPFGSAAWTTVTTSMLGLEASLRPMRRPRKLAETQNTPVLPSTVIAKSYQSPAIPSGHTCAFERS